MSVVARRAASLKAIKPGRPARAVEAVRRALYRRYVGQYFPQDRLV